MLDLPFNRALTIASLGLVLIGGLCASGVWDVPDWWLSGDAAVVSFFGVILFTCGILSLSLLCRCQQCRLALFWHAINDREPRGLAWFVTASQCPRCGTRGN